MVGRTSGDRGRVVLELAVASDVVAEGEGEDSALESCRTWVDPVRCHLAERRLFVNSEVVRGPPRVHSASVEDGVAVAGGEVAADNEAVEAVDAAFSLFEVDGVGRGVPVDGGVAPSVEVDAFLADAGGGEDPGPEGAVESGADLRMMRSSRRCQTSGALWGSCGGADRRIEWRRCV